MTPDAFKARLSALGLTHEAFAAEIGRSGRQITRYAQGQSAIPKSVSMLLEGRGLDKGEK